MLKFLDKPLFKPENRTFWIITALFIRVCLLLIFIDSARQTFPDRMISGFVMMQNDYEYFLGPVDEYYKTGIFQYEHAPGKTFAGRMPGYSFPYLVLRSFLEKDSAQTVLFTLQILLSAICVYLLSLTAYKVVKRREIFIVTFLLFAISIHTSIFDIFTLAESFSVSAIILFLYYGVKYFETEKAFHLLLAGLFAAWAIFLRPFLGLILVLMPALIFIYRKKQDTIGRLIKLSFIFALPFILFETAWIARNFSSLGKFIPLETSLSESYGERGAYRTSAISIRQLINSWGGEPGEFYEGSEGEWFHFAPLEKAGEYHFNDYVFNSTFNRDSLIYLKKIFNASVDETYSESQKDSLNMLASTIALRYAADYKKNNTLRFYLLNPVIRTYRLVLPNGTRLLPLPPFSQMNIFQKAVKLFYFGFYFVITLSGIAGMLIFLIKDRNKNPGAMLLLVYPVVILLTLTFFSSIIEYRYYITAYPVFVIFTAWFYLFAYERITKNKSSVSASVLIK